MSAVSGEPAGTVGNSDAVAALNFPHEESSVSPTEQQEEHLGAIAQSLLTLPDELLAEIFSYRCAGPDDYNDMQVLQTNRERARAPFIVAAVCRRWRDVALGHAVLWHYLPIPVVKRSANWDSASCARMGHYVRLVLDRSREHPIDVIFCYLRGSHGMVGAMDQLVFLALEEHAHRWRRFAAVMYGKYPVARILRLLSGRSMPHLRTLELSVQEFSSTPTFSIGNSPMHYDVALEPPVLFLQRTPALRSVTFINLPEVVRRWVHTCIPEESGCRLELVQQELTTYMWDMLEKHQHQLSWLLLSVHQISKPPELFQTFGFNKLDLLWLNYEACDILFHHHERLNMPVLRELVLLGVRSSITALTPWFRRVRSTLVALDLRDVTNFDAQEVDAMGILDRLEVLQLSGGMKIPNALLLKLSNGIDDSMSPIETVPVDSKFKQLPVSWPRLRLLELFRASFHSPVPPVSDSDNTSLDSDSMPPNSSGIELLVSVVSSRCPRAGPIDAQGTPRWAQLSILMSRCDISEQQRDELRAAGDGRIEFQQ